MNSESTAAQQKIPRQQTDVSVTEEIAVVQTNVATSVRHEFSSYDVTECKLCDIWEETDKGFLTDTYVTISSTYII